MSSMTFSSCYHALISGCNWDFSHIVSCSLAFGCHVAHIPLWPTKWPDNKSGFLSSGYPYQEIHEINFSWRMALSCSGVVRVNKKCGRHTLKADFLSLLKSLAS